MPPVLYVASIVSLGIPYVLYIVAWLLFLGKAGPFNRLLHGGVRPALHINVYSLGGMIFVEGMLWSPLAFLLLAPVFRNSDASFEEAAGMCGAGMPVDHAPRHARHGAAGALALGTAGVHQGIGVVRGAGAGRPARATRVLTSTIYQRLIARGAAGHR